MHAEGVTTPDGPPTEPTYPPPVPYGAPVPAPPTLTERLRRLAAPVIAAVVGVAKYGAILLKFKAFTLVFSMVASLWAYALLYGWQFALGFVLLIFIHEMGHVIVLRARGIEAGLPVFLPFLGAFVSMKSAPKSAYDESLSGIAGPVFGVLGAFGALGLAGVYHSDLLRVIAYFGFLINLFNLLPVLPLDGGRTVASLSPKIWLAGLLMLLGYEVWRPSPMIPIILLIGGFELYRRWKGRNSEASKAYFTLTMQQRLNIGGAYVGLIVVILWAMHSYPLPPR
ncbi:MAG: putative Zn-dependent protease [Frankiales bacterium]|nr:putative Zn-dependent protease [Frankiales bacterium]